MSRSQGCGGVDEEVQGDGGFAEDSADTAVPAAPHV